MRPNEQLIKWVKGKSVHDHEQDVCCPDFSCCQPELLAPIEEREAFLSLPDDERFRFLGMFLGRAMELAAKGKVYIAGMLEENST